MCLICDGADPEDVLAGQLANIDRYAFTMVHVESEVPWTYSIGLRWTLALPELVVVGWPAEAASHVIHLVVDAARSDPKIARCGGLLTVDKGEIRFGRVDPKNLAGEWFAAWPEVARAAGQGATSLRALQVRPGCAADCREPHDLLDRALERRRTPETVARFRRARLGLDP